MGVQTRREETLGTLRAAAEEGLSPKAPGGRRILAAVDLTPESKAAARAAADLAGWSAAGLTLVHVSEIQGAEGLPSPDGRAADRLRRWVEKVETLDAWAGECRKAGVPTNALVLEGIPSEVILRLSPAFSLVVLGKPSHRRWWRLFSERTAAAVLAGCRTHVVVAQPPVTPA